MGLNRLIPIIRIRQAVGVARSVAIYCERAEAESPTRWIPSFDDAHAGKLSADMRRRSGTPRIQVDVVVFDLYARNVG
jgi:hypothetical protein